MLTASPGIFSACMIGMGRAVGETMIVLMATGNTPIMDMNIFEGFRALSANIAVEMLESAVGSTPLQDFIFSSFFSVSCDFRSEYHFRNCSPKVKSKNTQICNT